ncbi:DMT family transporter [Hydromonas duriensis]|uniref:EamA domain-containing membrane protein RarD n=1 Tax=Hydromonas duriensis TaxID=1527608 RepID=A0A4R6YC55_9BURK|nr:DMT family transporter [Hydromonas duriensis]TDR33191.1 EamA domain-containing membrane protein RarD [Hydromonas duriensis]
MTSNATLSFRGYALLACSMLLVGAYVAFSKALLPYFPPFALAWLRFIMAAVTMAPWLLEWRGQWRGLTTTNKWVLFSMSFFGNFLFTICMLFGVANTSVSAAGIIMSLLPATIALFSVWFLKERLSGAVLLAIVLAVAGVASLSLNKADAHQTFLGNALMVGALGCEAMYVVGAKYLTGSFSAKQIAVSMNSTGLLLSMPLGVWQTSQMDLAAVPLHAWLLLAVYAIAASQVAPWLWFRGLKHIPANRAGVMTVALPIASAAIGVLWFKESLTTAHVFAFICALIGVALVTRVKSKV